jgi:hypothetical protein
VEIQVRRLWVFALYQMTNSAVESDQSSRRLLRLSRWSAILPGALGVSAVVGWYAAGGRTEDVGPFYFAGILAIGLGILLLPVGLGLLALAFRRGASTRAIVLGIAILFANIPLAVVCWKMAGSLLDLHIVSITNSADHVLGPVRVWIEPPIASEHAVEIEALQPGETRTWVLHYSNEGVATFRAQDGSTTIEPNADERIFLGIGQPMEVQLEFYDNGEYRLDGVFARRWWWLTALRN